MKAITLEWQNNGNLLNTWKLQNNQSYILGRSKHADIVVELSTMSRKHAKITIDTEGSASIEDLNSTNGTKIYDKWLQNNEIIFLKNKTQIQFGENSEVMVMKSCLFLKIKNGQLEKTIKQDAQKAQTEQKGLKKIEKSRSRSRSRSKSQDKDKNEKINFVSHQNIPQKINQYQQQGPINYNQKIIALGFNKNFFNYLNKGNKTINEKEIKQETKLAKLKIVDADENEKIKFMKLMGVKDDQIRESSKISQQQSQKTLNQQNKIKEELEKQFEVGLKWKYGRKIGLGFQ